MFLIPKCLSDPVIEIKDESVNEVIDELVNNIENTTFQIINENNDNIESITDKKLSIVKKMLNNIIDIIDNQDDKDFDNYEEDNYDDDEDDDDDDEEDDEDDDEEDEEDDDEDDDEEDDDEEDDEEDDEDDDEDDEEKLYIISINDEPCFYENSLKSAKSKILRISNVLDRKNNKEYTSYICHSNTNKIDVIRNLNFILFSYNYILYSLKISSVAKCKL